MLLLNIRDEFLFTKTLKTKVIQPKNPNDSPILPAGKTRRALVIGGGLAGLSAALELADRGYNVKCLPFR